MPMVEYEPACSTDTFPRRVERADVIKTISPNDAMFAGDEEHYFSVGESALECIRIALEAARKRAQDIKTVLDLPCGHGRVLRYLRKALSEAQITACDLDKDGVDFCASVLGVRGVYSSKDPRQIPLEHDSFDLIWVGSLLTHLSSQLWTDFLLLFRALLRPGGVLVFSTHGSYVYERMRRENLDYGLGASSRTAVVNDYERCGFGYANYEGNDSFGISIASPAAVCARVARAEELRICHLAEKAWDNHHDCFACLRDPLWQPGPP